MLKAMKKYYLTGLIIPLLLLLLIPAKATATICFVDDFNRANGNPGADWAVNSSGGTVFFPAIFNNRLRLTDANGNEATVATLQRSFPAQET